MRGRKDMGSLYPIDTHDKLAIHKMDWFIYLGSQVSYKIIAIEVWNSDIVCLLDVPRETTGLADRR